MKKKTLSLALALVMCLGLTVPALAAEQPANATEAFQNVSLSYPLGNGHNGGFTSSGDFTSNIGVDKPWTMVYEDWYEETEVTNTISGYYAMRANTTFTLTNSDPADTSFIQIYLTTYYDRGNDRYEWADTFHGEYLTNSGNFLEDIFDPEENGGLVELKGGQSIQFTMPEGRGDVIYRLEFEKCYPDFAHEETDEWGNTDMVMPYWSRYLYLKVDEAGVDEGLKKLEVSTQPQQPAEVKTANPTNDKLEVNGAAANPTVYKIGGSNYFKIRDVAAVLNGTEKQFAVGYSGGKVTVTSGQPYEATGKELAGAPDSAKDASPSNDAIVIDGTETSLTVYKIGGSNYFKLRDLGEALNFYVGWEAGRGVYIETDKPYSK